MDINNKIQNTCFSARVMYKNIPVKDFKELIERGYSYKEIGDIYNIPRHAVYRMAKHYNIKSYFANYFAKINNTEQVNEITLLEDIIKKLNINKDTIEKSVKLDIEV